jgi:hypothetical protein
MYTDIERKALFVDMELHTVTIYNGITWKQSKATFAANLPCLFTSTYTGLRYDRRNQVCPLCRSVLISTVSLHFEEIVKIGEPLASF